MLKKLYIQNLALIQELEIELTSGFNVITGQSGAGKSLVLSALYLLRGEKASTHLIRSGEAKATIQGTFQITSEEAKQLQLQEKKVVLKREIARGSASKAFINNQKVSLEDLKNLGEQLFDICHQSDTTFQFSEETQLDILDQFAKLFPERQKYFEVYQQWERVRQKLQKTSKLDPEALAEEVETLNEFAPSKEDYLQLEQERLRLENATVIRQTLATSYDRIYTREENSILTELSLIKKQIAQLLPYGDVYKNILQQLTEAECFLQEASYLMRDQDIEVDESRLYDVQKRLGRYKEFFRKYNCTIDELLEHWNQLAEQCQSINEGLHERETLEREEREYYQALQLFAKELHEKRQAVTNSFCRLIEEQLDQLGMESRLDIRLLQNVALSPTGITQVEFLISTNKGEELKPLSKIASGGERSRFILALKSLVDQIGIPIFVFDELDSTLGNRFAKEVGHKLKTLSKNHQVISATHSPLIAAFGDRHLLVSKQSSGEKTFTSVKILTGEEKERELLAMFQGADGPLEIEMLQKILIH